MNETNTFIAGLSFICGILVTGFAIFIITDPISKELLIKNRTLNYKNVKYNVTIDSSATDSLFGKTWRK